MAEQLPANLLNQINKKLLVLLRDGRTLIGYLRMFDQFQSLILHDAIERIYVGNKFGDIHRGVFLIRGDNISLCGEFDENSQQTLQEVSIEEILELQQEELEERSEKERKRRQIIEHLGLNFNVESIFDGDADVE